MKSIKRMVHDGWQNLMTGLGIQNRDKTVSTTFANTIRLSEVSLTELYRGEGMAKRIVELPVQDMTRKGFEIDGDTDAIVESDFKRMGMYDHFREMLRWRSVYGGSILGLWIDDGLDLEQPLDLNNMKKIEMVKVFQRWRVDRTTDVDRDPDSMTFLKPIHYRITPIGGGQFRMHWTRVIPMDGLPLEDQERHRNNGWGDSVYQAIYDYLRGHAGMFSSVEHIMEGFETAVLSIKNLQELISQPGGEELIKTRINLLDLSRHVINTLLIDSEEQYEKKSSSLSGIETMIDRFVQRIAGATGIPFSLLTGTQPKGLNAEGKEDVRLYYDNIKSQQEMILEPALRRFLTILMLTKDGPTNGKELEDWGIKFNPLWEQTDKEIVETRKTQSETDQRYIENGVLLPVEVRESRFGGNEYSLETEIDESITKQLKETPEEPEEPEKPEEPEEPEGNE